MAKTGIGKTKVMISAFLFKIIAGIVLNRKKFIYLPLNNPENVSQNTIDRHHFIIIAVSQLFL